MIFRNRFIPAPSFLKSYGSGVMVALVVVTIIQVRRRPGPARPGTRTRLRVRLVNYTATTQQSDCHFTAEPFLVLLISMPLDLQVSMYRYEPSYMYVQFPHASDNLKHFFFCRKFPKLLRQKAPDPRCKMPLSIYLFSILKKKRSKL